MPSPNSNLVTPSTPSTVYDIDGNVYGIVTIGSQVWMNENLKTTKYNDGFTIPNIADEQEWYVSFNGASCDYDNNAINSDIYGKLYNWYTVASTNPKNVCPAGWHVPSDEEWTVLINFLGGVSIAGGKLKESGFAHWTDPNTGATNETGFTALPGGGRFDGGNFYDFGGAGIYWTSTENNAATALLQLLLYDSSAITWHDDPKSHGYSVRCVKD
ncbi:MAG: fibrobacter succinogenes major paralogous domain-containing protein [Bacteroidales bacterium]|nr:fibrobacter succinogenes major paralogous domain-containing protein [Bacteroidales bacterium]